VGIDSIASETSDLVSATSSPYDILDYIIAESKITEFYFGSTKYSLRL